jgi:hypothetical protein
MKKATPPQSSPFNTSLDNTTTSAQRERLLRFLIDNGSVNTMFARDRLNIMAPAARIKELREQDHKIHTDRIVINDRDGRRHNKVARYVLLELAEVRQ